MDWQGTRYDAAKPIDWTQLEVDMGVICKVCHKKNPEIVCHKQIFVIIPGTNGQGIKDFARDGALCQRCYELSSRNQQHG